MNYLLDVNVLVAWGWSDHVDHKRVALWIASIGAKDRILTSAIPQLGFVRVSAQRTNGWVSVHEAASVLSGMISTLEKRHQFLPDDSDSTRLPGWCTSAGNTTDAHLLELASAHGAKLATLDARIPGAFLIPAISSTPRN